MVRRKFTLLFLGWMVLITSLSLFSFSVDTEETIWFPHLDKAVHFTFHLVIVVLGVLFIGETEKNVWQWRKKLVFLLFFSLSYGLTIEFLQWVMPLDRSAEIWDVLANTSGALVGGLLIQTNRSRIEGLK